MKKRFWFLVVPLAWMTCQFYFSTDAMSSDATRPVFEPVVRTALRVAGRTATADNLWWGHYVFRKAGHVASYALLAFAWALALHEFGLVPLRRVLMAAGVLTVGYALLDEWHQTFTWMRSGTPGDVLIDSLGAMVGLYFFSLWLFLRRRHEGNQAQV